MKLLQVPTANLEERIKEELEENPALELAEDSHEDQYDNELQDEFESSDDDYEMDGSEEDYENIDISEYVGDENGEIADYKLRDDNYPEIDDNKVVPYKVETTFHEYLLSQLGLVKMDDKQRRIAEQIVGSIDDDGYLRRDTAAIVDDLAFRQNIESNEAEVEAVIKMVQQFDPPGVGARDLQECLLLQLNRQKAEGKNVEKAIAVLTDYFDEFTKKHYDKIQRGLNLDDEGLKDVITQITRLTPKPGGNHGDINKAESYVVPDFFVYNNGGKLELTLNSKNAPDLRISEGYRDMLRDYEKGSKKDRRQKEAVLFIKQK
jgi:RNA polymerase, sigma 54 subunit, RpoN/SigL